MSSSPSLLARCSELPSALFLCCCCWSGAEDEKLSALRATPKASATSRRRRRCCCCASGTGASDRRALEPPPAVHGLLVLELVLLVLLVLLTGSRTGRAGNEDGGCGAGEVRGTAAVVMAAPRQRPPLYARRGWRRPQPRWPCPAYLRSRSEMKQHAAAECASSVKLSRRAPRPVSICSFMSNFGTPALADVAR